MCATCIQRPIDLIPMHGIYSNCFAWPPHAHSRSFRHASVAKRGTSKFLETMHRGYVNVACHLLPLYLSMSISDNINGPN